LKYKVSTLLIILFTIPFFGQVNKIIDSLKIELSKQQPDSVKMQVLSDLSYYYLYQSTDTSLIYGKDLVAYSSTKKSEKFKAKAYRNMGNAFMYSNQYDSAYVYFDKAFKVLDKNNFDKSAVYSSIGMLQKRKGNYEDALKTYFDGIRYDEETNNEYGKFIKLLNAASVYFILEDIDKSIDFQLKAIAISDATDNPNITYAKGTILNNIAVNYITVEKFVVAMEYLEKSLAFNLKSQNKKELARTYNNIGTVYEKQNQLNKALDNLNKALVLRKEIGDVDELIETHMALGTTYGKLKQSKKSTQHFAIALEKATSANNLSLISETYLSISNNYGLQNNPMKELENYRHHIQFRDSIFKLTNLENINEIDAKYESEKKDKELAKQQLEIQKTSTQYNYMTGLAIFLLIAAILTFVVFQQRQKRKNQEIVTLKREHQIKTLESLIEGEEKERFRIAKELHDGVNGDLSAIKFKLSSLLEMNNKVIKEAITMIDDSCQQVRAISHNLVPQSLVNFNFIEAIQEYCNNMDAIHKPQISFQKLGEHIDIEKKSELNIFRIIQELVTNSVKHAEASEINVQISCRDNLMHITFEDDGKGFDKNQVESDGIGLKNIPSRIDYLNASIDLISNKQGTSYTIEIDTNKLNDH
jgi:signal transduction histidine kinase